VSVEVIKIVLQVKTHAYGGKFVRYMNKFISAIICLQIRHSNYSSIMFRARLFHEETTFWWMVSTNVDRSVGL
jgi:hypothetical protein